LPSLVSYQIGLTYDAISATVSLFFLKELR